MENPSETAAFFGALRSGLSPGAKVEVILSDLKNISSESVVALVALFDKATRARVRVHGPHPEDPVALRLLVESGFYDTVRSGVPLPAHERLATFTRLTGKRVIDGQAVHDLILRTTKRALGIELPLPHAYDVILEATMNSHNHASRSKKVGKENWWVMAHAGPNAEFAEMTVIDLGVGIIGSLKLKRITRALRRVGVTGDCNVLQSLFEGQIGSRTGLEWRGKGLIEMAELCKGGEIEDLIVVSNRAIFKVREGTYFESPFAFKGTLLHWKSRIPRELSNAP